MGVVGKNEAFCYGCRFGGEPGLLRLQPFQFSPAFSLACPIYLFFAESFRNHLPNFPRIFQKNAKIKNFFFALECLKSTLELRNQRSNARRSFCCSLSPVTQIRV